MSEATSHPDPERLLDLVLGTLPADQARRTGGAAAAITVDPAAGIREAGSVRRFSLGY